MAYMYICHYSGTKPWRNSGFFEHTVTVESLKLDEFGYPIRTCAETLIFMVFKNTVFKLSGFLMKTQCYNFTF